MREDVPDGLLVFDEADNASDSLILINIDIVRTNMLFFVFNPGEIKFEKK
jgi:hypothetical protein